MLPWTKAPIGLCPECITAPVFGLDCSGQRWDEEGELVWSRGLKKASFKFMSRRVERQAAVLRLLNRHPLT